MRRTAKFLTAALLAWLLITTTSRFAAAGDDGGGRSVFARGAGNRALALGGAYAAAGDDPSAALYNPGSLAFLDRRQFQVTHTNLIGLGFGEQYASFVLPSWRWGVGSLTYRHFGTDGIDQRNERNEILGENLSDGETEIDLAYGRRLGSAWGVGGAVKLQRQSLAGMSDSDLGFDAGVRLLPLVAAGSRVAWAQDLSLGLAVRNLIEPSLRLDEEAVPDPTGIRLGAAFQRPFWKEGLLLGTVDLEKTRNMDSRLHMGLEMRVNPYLALRGGLHDGMLTAGTGVTWHDVAFDYAFEDNVISSVHRFGVSFAFGLTIQQSRRTALAAQEAELEQKLQAAVAARSQERLTDLLSQAQGALQVRDYDSALETLAMIRVLEPGHPQLEPLEAAAYRGRGLVLEQAGDFGGATVALGRALALDSQDGQTRSALARVRSKSDLQAARTVEIRQLLDQAMDAYAAGDLGAASSDFQKLLEVSPGDSEAAAMLRRTEEAMHRQAEDLVQQARLLIKAGQFAEAEAALDKASGFDPEADGLPAATTLLARTRRGTELARARPAPPAAKPADTAPDIEQVAVSETAPPSGQPLSADARREIEDLYRRGLAALEEGRSDDAIRYWEIVWERDPGHQRVAAALKREYLTRGIESFATGSLAEAVSDWEKVLQIDPDDERAKGYLKRANEQLSRIQKLVTTP